MQHSLSTLGEMKRAVSVEFNMRDWLLRFILGDVGIYTIVFDVYQSDWGLFELEKNTALHEMIDEISLDKVFDSLPTF